MATIARLHDATPLLVAASILNAIIARMNRRSRTTALVANRAAGIPRPQDIVGIIDANEIAGAIIANHYG